jgi:hypothetical protein
MVKIRVTKQEGGSLCGVPRFPMEKIGVAGYFFDEAYPSAYHPPPFSSKLQAEMIFLA